jgi:hypothetical protein
MKLVFTLDAAGDAITMTIAQDSIGARESMSDREQKFVALGYLQEAWAQACLFAALTEFVTTYGEEATANLANGLSDRIRNGEFSIERARQ